MDPLTAAGLGAAAFAAGAINAVAGGGSLVSFPALIAAGYGSKAANVTNTVALWPGYVGGTIGYRGELRRQRRRIAVLSVPAVLGSLAGSAILLATPEAAFDAIVPFLILFACGVMAFHAPLAEFARRRRLAARDAAHLPAGLLGAVFVLAIYGAYFGGGLGIIMLAVLAILLPDDLQHSNALKGLLSAVINFAAVTAFVLFGPVEWAAAAVMAGGALAGGYLGVGLARRLGQRWLRVAVITYGIVAAGVLLVR
ncbi:sulfite exporter TauE/SafE family protein [Tepidiforma sp.]|uniref:sulfite exporter TauE/SafE family protein n=1 Tax=Tepidiforma sp. TaxID=2682230 RepID=UPI002ADDAB7F|nr:sulfite exporter TauE/SafE family protein [Tepidiforma sp.]